jgi:hypothetical protein
MEKIKGQYRQGDVLIMPESKTVPADLKAIEPVNDRTILAYGEVTGHAHALPAKDVRLHEAKGFVDRFLVVMKATALGHEEHGRIPIAKTPARTARRVIIQKEYHPEVIRNVAD